ncbi:MAG: RNA pseudouridine synthase [Treponema sp.]|nr:RNA pseudouridine synthase [Treponema sp.]
MEKADGPRIIDENGDFAVLFKPARMHCAPVKGGEGRTLLAWYARSFPPVLELVGKKVGEGGLLHRLDFETSGLVLVARNRAALDGLLAQQSQGGFVKEYRAVCRNPGPPPDSFPPSPGFPGRPFSIESFFRPFGPGRKQVRPVTDLPKGRADVAGDRGRPYRTEITEIAGPAAGFPGHFRCTARLARGFRHQVRCHLAWVGCPIRGDPLYGDPLTDDPDQENPFLALHAVGLFFEDPSSGRSLEYLL